MTDKGKFGTNKPSEPSGGQAVQFDCAAVELWLAEAAEESLISSSVKKRLSDHAAGCVSCREKLEWARRGREWMRVLKQESLEPPADMVAKILAKTSLRANLIAAPDAKIAARDVVATGSPTDFGVISDGPFAWVESGGRIGQSQKGSAREVSLPEEDSAPSRTSVPAWQQNSVVVLRRTLLEPRLALVAAMAFFSITLTLNLMGVRLTDMHVTDLQPQNLSRAVTRQYADANARMVRYYENLRIVYEVESRVQQIRRAAQTSPQSQQAGSKPRKRSSNGNRDSNSDRTESHRAGMAIDPGARGSKHAVAPQAIPDPLPVVTGPRLDATFRRQAGRPRLAPGTWEQQSMGLAYARPTTASVVPKTSFRPASQRTLRAVRSTYFSMRRFSTRERRLA